VVNRQVDNSTAARAIFAVNPTISFVIKMSFEFSPLSGKLSLNRH